MAGRSDIRAGAAYVRLYTRDADFLTGLKKASERLQSFGTILASIGAAVMSIGTSIGAVMLKAIGHFADLGDAANKAAQRTGLTTNAVSELGYAAEQCDSNIEELEGGIRKMQKTIADAKEGSKAARDTLHDLGITFDMLNETPDAQLELFAEQLSKIEDPGERAALAMEIFGKSGTNLLPLLLEGAAGIRALREEARQLGQSIDPADAQAATDLGDEWDRVKKSVMGAVFSIGGALAPVLQAVLTPLREIVVEAANWIRGNKELVVTIAKITAGVTVAGAIIAGLGVAMIGTGAAITGAITVFGALSTAVAGVASTLAGLFGAVASAPVLVTAAVAATVAWLAFSESGRATLGAFRDALLAIPDVVRDVVAQSIAVAQTLGESIADTARNGADMAMSALSAVVDWVSSTGDSISDAIAGWFPDVAAIVRRAFSGAVAVVRSVMAGVSEVFTRVLGAARLAWSGIVDTARGAWTFIIDAHRSAFSMIVESFRSFGTAAMNTWSAVSAAFSSAWSTLTADFSAIWGGITDAIMSGDLALAGQIAMTGLQLVFAQGLAGLSSLIGDVFGDTIATIGAQISGGDFAGAWETTVQGMAAIWDAWAEGVVKTFTGVTRAVMDAWKNTVAGISNMILEAAAQGGVMGKVMSKVLGVDITAEDAKAERMRLEQIAVQRRELATAEEDAAKAAQRGDMPEAQKQQRLANDFRKSLAKLEGTPVDLLGDMTSDVDRQLGTSLASVNNFLDMVDKTATDKADAAGQALADNVSGGAAQATDRVAQLQAELDSLRAEAGKKREDILAGKKPVGQATEGRQFGKQGGDASKQLGSFSAAALMAGGTGPQERLAKLAEDQKKIAADTKTAIEKQTLEVARQTAVMSVFTTLFKYT